jgi:hypothetical protein
MHVCDNASHMRTCTRYSQFSFSKVNQGVKLRGMTISAIVQKNNWGKLWNPSQAAFFLIADPLASASDTSLLDYLDDRMTAALKGQPQTFEHGESLRHCAEDLRAFVATCKEGFGKEEQGAFRSLPPALWLRWCLDRKLKVHPQSLLAIALWQFRCESAGKHYLYKYKNPETNKFAGRTHVLTGERGYTAIELFDANSERDGVHVLWPFWLTWKVTRYDRSKPPARALKPSNDSTESKRVSAAVIQSATTKATKKTKKKTKPQSIDDLRRKCGSFVVERLENALAQEIKRRGGYLARQSKGNKIYASETSQSELIGWLQKRNPKTLGKGGKGNLQKALSFFVAFQRGRPATLEERPTSAKGKKPR